MSFYQTVNYVTASHAASATVVYSIPISYRNIILHKIKVAPDIAAGNQTVKIFKAATALDADLVYATNSYIGTLVDPAEIDGYASTERTEGIITVFENGDDANYLYMEITNDYSSAKVYTIDISYSVLSRETMVNILDFNLTADGATDDTSGIQDAIDHAASLSGGGIVYCPPGSYAYTPLTLNTSNVCMIGAGAGVTNFVYLNSSGDGITIGNNSAFTDNVIVSGINFTQLPAVTKTSGSCISALNLRRAKIENLFLEDFYNGISFTGSDTVEINSIKLLETNKSGSDFNRAFQFLYNSTLAQNCVNTRLSNLDGEVLGAPADYMSSYLYIESADRLRLENSHLGGPNYTMHVLQVGRTIKDLSIKGNFFYIAPYCHIYTEGSTGTDYSNWSFKNNTFNSAALPSFYLTHQAEISDVHIIDNKFNSIATSAIEQSDENIVNLDIAGNIFKETPSSGGNNIMTLKAKHISVNNNDFSNTSATPSYVVSASRAGATGSLSITGNNFLNSGASGSAPMVYSSGYAPAIRRGNVSEADNYQIITLADNATPNVIGGNYFVTGGTTTITDFDGGFAGQVITIIAEHTITIDDNTNIILAGSVDWTMNATDTLTLIQKSDTYWYEISRSDNS